MVFSSGKDINRSSCLKMFLKIGVLIFFVNFTGKHLCWSLCWRPWGLQLYLRDTPKQVFSCENCKISRTTFFHRTPPVAVSALTFTQRLDERWSETKLIKLKPTFQEILQKGLPLLYVSLNSYGNNFFMFCFILFCCSWERFYDYVYEWIFTYIKGLVLSALFIIYLQELEI